MDFPLVDDPMSIDERNAEGNPVIPLEGGGGGGGGGDTTMEDPIEIDEIESIDNNDNIDTNHNNNNNNIDGTDNEGNIHNVEQINITMDTTTTTTTINVDDNAAADTAITTITNNNNSNNNDNITSDTNNNTNNNDNNDIIHQKDDNVNDKKGNVEGEGGEEEVQVLSPAQVEKERRRKRRRQLHRLLQKPGTVPSFMAIISKPPAEVIDVDAEDDNNNNHHQDKKDEHEIEVLPMVIIDVDKYIGLKDDYDAPHIVSSSAPTIVPTTPLSGGGTSRTRSIRAAATTTSSSSSTAAMTTNTPAEEGWYEGVRIMAMPEDRMYLGEMQQWVRQNLEYFSATERDVKMSQAGRRTPTVRGKVGIRCIHCAKAVLADPTKQWPPGSVSYPLNVSGLYSGCAQKPQLHFEHCPYLPSDSKLKAMLQESRANQLSNTSSSGSAGSKRKRMPQGVSALMYYTISCQRIGMLELGTGLRFGRDLALEPLPFETIKLKVEHEQPNLIPRQYQIANNSSSSGRHASSSVQPDAPASTSGSTGDTPDRARSSNAAPVVADETCQKLLTEAVDSIPSDTGLVRKSDRTLVSDFIFLTICQMTICHASQTDFLTRGKKTKLMRLGLAGFCCKHCQTHSSYSCRSFSSVPDNLASAISNSFVLHLQKCPYAPRPIQQGLASLKRIHTAQMNRLPYGSQRKLFFEMWQRLRELDKDPSEMPAEVLAVPAVPAQVPSAAAALPFQPAAAPKPAKTPKSRVDPDKIPVRGAGFPVSTDEATIKTLKEAEDNWPTGENGELITPADRNLVSDYVFLTMRQLKIATPTPGDFRGNRRNNVLSRMAGFCCLHCAKDPSFTTPSGRSFPSAPDNMASALNSSLYNHMQHCPYLPPAFKHAFVNLKKLHSAQCASLAFGSQRRFFNKVYAKLKAIPISQEAFAKTPKQSPVRTSASSSIAATRRPVLADAAALTTYAFVKRSPHGGAAAAAAPVYQCLQCRSVPFDFRASGAVHFVCPPVDAIQKHHSICQKDGIDLTMVKTEYQSLKTEYNAVFSAPDVTATTTTTTITPLIRSVVGDDKDLIQLFSQPFLEESNVSTSGGAWRRLKSNVNLDEVRSAFQEMAAKLDLKSSDLSDHPKWIQYLQVISPYLDCQRFEEERIQREKEEEDKKKAEIEAAAAAAKQAAERLAADNAAAKQAAESLSADNAAVKQAAVSAPRDSATAEPAAGNIPAGSGATAEPAAENIPADSGATAEPAAESIPAGSGATAEPAAESIPAGSGAAAKPTAESIPAGSATAKPVAESVPPDSATAAEPAAESIPPDSATAKPAAENIPPDSGTTSGVQQGPQPTANAIIPATSTTNTTTTAPMDLEVTDTTTIDEKRQETFTEADRISIMDTVIPTLAAGGSEALVEPPATTTTTTTAATVDTSTAPMQLDVGDFGGPPLGTAMESVPGVASTTTTTTTAAATASATFGMPRASGTDDDDDNNSFPW